MKKRHAERNRERWDMGIFVTYPQSINITRQVRDIRRTVGKGVAQTASRSADMGGQTTHVCITRQRERSPVCVHAVTSIVGTAPLGALPLLDTPAGFLPANHAC